MCASALEPVAAACCCSSGDHVLDLHAAVPDLQVGHGRHLPHGLAGTRCPRPTTASVRTLLENPRSRPATTTLAARRLTSHSQGPGQRLVEVVAVEDELALGRAEDAEVGEVGVAADLGRQARARRRREVRRHDQRRPPEEGEGRDQHPAVADGDELGHPRRGLLLEERRPGRAGRAPARSRRGCPGAPWPGPPSPSPCSRPRSGAGAPGAADCPPAGSPRQSPSSATSPDSVAAQSCRARGYAGPGAAGRPG